MPVTVKTFATPGRSGGGAVVGPRRALSRRRHAGHARAQRRRPFDLDPRARSSDRALTQIEIASARITIGAGVTLRADPARARPRLPASASRARSAGRRCATWARSAAICSRPRRSAISPSRCLRSTRRFRCRAAMARATCRSRSSSPGAIASPARSCCRVSLRAPGQPRSVPLSQGRARQAEGRLGADDRRPSSDSRRARFRRAHRLWRDGADADARQGRRARARRARARRSRRSPPRSRPRRRAPRPSTTRSPAPGIGARSSASICAACCSARTRESSDGQDRRCNSVTTAATSRVFVDGGDQSAHRAARRWSAT